MSIRPVVVACLTLGSALAMSSPAAAWHISGTVYCDHDNDAQIDGGDSRLSGVSVKITSQAGTNFFDTTDGNGEYDRSLPDQPDTYQVRLSSLPTGWTVVVPSGGSHTVQLTNSNSSRSGVNFLVQGCAGPTSTTSTSSSTSSTSTSRTSTSSSSTSTSTSSTTSTTFVLGSGCDCDDFAFSVSREAKYNNDATLNGNVLANDPDGRVRTGKNVVMPDGSVIVASSVTLGNSTSVFDVRADDVFRGQGATIRGTSLAAPPLPVETPFCSIPTFDCGTTEVWVQTGEFTQPLAPGSYGRVRVLNGGTLRLAGGTYEFCELKTGRDAAVVTDGPTTMNVVKTVSVGSGAVVGPAGGVPIPTINLAGRSLRVSQGATLSAKVSAPAAKVTFGRDAMLLGCYCALQSKSDKHITLTCVE